MRTIKIKLGVASTLAHPLASLGETGSGATIVAIHNVPDDVPAAKLVGKINYTWFLAAQLSQAVPRYDINYDELGACGNLTMIKTA